MSATIEATPEKERSIPTGPNGAPRGRPTPERRAGAALFAVGIALLLLDILHDGIDIHTYIGAGLLVVAALLYIGGLKNFTIKVPGGAELSARRAASSEAVYYRETMRIAEQIRPRQLPSEVISERLSYVEGRQVPGNDAPALNPFSLTLASDLLVRPSAYPMTPMYMLDKYYRIIDWNLALSLAFNGTMEGLIGHGILEWTFWLDNYREVVDHGLKVFRDEGQLPTIDKERIEYTNPRYGKIRAIKRAYQVPDDDGNCLAWLATLDLSFAEGMQEKYTSELVRLLGLDQLWTEYASSYDRVLLNTKVYLELISLLAGIGRDAPPRRLAEDAIVLDLGAGTGNLSKLLIEESPRRTIFAVEQNRAMLDILRSKCSRYASEDRRGSGIHVVRQNVTNLEGFADECCDCVLINNVLYSIPDFRSCLAEAFRVLKPGGELRLSEPRQDTVLDALFERIGDELRECGKYQELETDYFRVREINFFRLKPMLNRWTVAEMQEQLRLTGFSQSTYTNTEVYAGQSMLLCAVK